MCVIAYKPALAGFPSRDALMSCYASNPDGAGYMLATGKEVLIRKGFMEYGDFEDALERDRMRYGDGLPYVMHFRISTQAGVTRWGCHPYPVTGDICSMKDLERECNVGFAHNGILHDYSDGSWNYNDSMLFGSRFLSKTIRDDPQWYLDGRKVEDVARKAQGSRLAILSKDGHCELIGDWIQDGDIYYSNSSYISRKPDELWLCDDWIDDAPWDDTVDYGQGYCHGSDYYPYGPSEYWAEFYMYETGQYSFDIGNCPLTEDGNPSYCENCTNLYTCYDNLIDKEKTL